MVQLPQPWPQHMSAKEAHVKGALFGFFTALAGTRCQNSGGFTDMVPLGIYILQS